MVPSHHDLVSLGLLEHVEHILLVDRVDGFYADGGSALRHSEYVSNLDGEVIDDLAEHQPHDLEGHSCACVFQHFEECE